MFIGNVEQIWRFPVKSMAGEMLERCTVGQLGIPGDRGWTLRDQQSRQILAGSKTPLLMQCTASYRSEPEEGSDIPHVEMSLSDGTRLGSDEAIANEYLSRLLDKSVVLVPCQPAKGESNFDEYPIHVLTLSSLKAMARVNPGADWDVRRFRPNFFVKTEPGFDQLLEAEWAGRTLRIGNVVLKCEIPAERCAMANHAQDGLKKDPSILRSIVDEAGMNLGIYASVTGSGSVALNDRVELE